ncbi:hypothetical protein BIW19_01090 [Pseudomonas putida]|nr:hypothetical protein BIW19_01090 [Pseudomonas putida]
MKTRPIRCFALTIVGLMDEKPMMIWAAHYLSALAKALMDDAELGMMRWLHSTRGGTPNAAAIHNGGVGGLDHCG